MTLIEMALVIGLVISFIVIIAIGGRPYLEYRDAKQAGSALSAMKTAQRIYLSDYPTETVASLTIDKLLPYLPGSTVPEMPRINGARLTMDVAVFPPVAMQGGAVYDISPTADDGLWDSGK